MSYHVTNREEWKAFRTAIRQKMHRYQAGSLKVGVRADAWTPHEVFHHVLLVDSSTADLLERLVVKAGRLEPIEHPVEWAVRAELMDFPLDTAFSVPAFRGTEPKRNITAQALRALEDEVQLRHEALADQAEGFSLAKVSFPHPLAGKLNFYEWLVFGGVHEHLHLTQLESDLSSEFRP